MSSANFFLQRRLQTRVLAGMDNNSRSMVTSTAKKRQIIQGRHNTPISNNMRWRCIPESPFRSLSQTIGNLVPQNYYLQRNSFSTVQKEYGHITGVADDVARLIHKHASRPQTGASLQTLMKTGRGEFLHKTYDDHTHDDKSKLATDKILMQVASFLRHELPIRLAHRILDLDRVPHMKEMNSVKQVRDLYVTSFLELLSVEKQIQNMKEEEAFAAILESIYERHASVLVQMARGAFELRAAIRNGSISHDSRLGSNSGRNSVKFDAMEDTHAFLDRFYISRIG